MVFDVNSDVTEQFIKVADEHKTEINAPCNCADCVVGAVLYGAAKVVEKGGVWEPLTTRDLEDGGKIKCLKAAYFRDELAKCNGNTAIISTLLVKRGFRALTKDRTRTGFHEFYNPNKKSRVVEGVDTEEGTPSGTEDN
jgi:hypothetical protein